MDDEQGYTHFRKPPDVETCTNGWFCTSCHVNVHRRAFQEKLRIQADNENWSKRHSGFQTSIANDCKHLEGRCFCFWKLGKKWLREPWVRMILFDGYLMGHGESC